MNEITTFEQATALTGRKAIEFFSNADNVQPLIEQVKSEALSLVPNVSTKKGRDEIGSTALKVSKSRKVITESIDRSVADLKAKVQAATAVKKLVTEELNQVREQVLQPRNEWQAEQDRIEAERVAAIQGKITELAALGDYTADETKEDLAAKIDALENVDVSEFFAEFTAQAVKVVQDAIAALNSRIMQIIDEQKAEEQRQLLEAEQAKNRIQERLSNLVQIPLSMMSKSSAEINHKISKLESFEITAAEFSERAEEAKASLAQVVQQLDMMAKQAKIIEDMQQATEEAPEPAPEPIQQAVVEQAEESHYDSSKATRNAETEQLPQDNSAQESILHGLKHEAYEAHRKAEQKFYAYACELPIGKDREKAFEIYENIRLATRVF